MLVIFVGLKVIFKVVLIKISLMDKYVEYFQKIILNFKYYIEQNWRELEPSYYFLIIVFSKMMVVILWHIYSLR